MTLHYRLLLGPKLQVLLFENDNDHFKANSIISNEILS